jgi:hypothetical protein
MSILDRVKGACRCQGRVQTCVKHVVTRRVKEEKERTMGWLDQLYDQKRDIHWRMDQLRRFGYRRHD